MLWVFCSRMAHFIFKALRKTIINCFHVLGGGGDLYLTTFLPVLLVAGIVVCSPLANSLWV